jgi:hypothetical protein
MAVEFIFRMSPEQIRVENPRTGYHLEIGNRAVVRQQDGLLLALGEHKTGGGDDPDERSAKHASDPRVLTLFGAADAELEVEIKALEHLTYMLHRQSQGVQPIAHLAMKLVDGFDYILEIQGYEEFPEARRRALEESMQAHLRLRRLVINGREVEIPMWKRELEIWVRRLFIRGLPIGAVAAGYLALPQAIAVSRWSILGYLLAIAALSYYGGKALWMLAARGLVPRDYRLCMLQGTHHRLLPTDRWLARALWGVARSR